MDNKSKFIDLDKVLYRCKERVHRIGIELEGGWDKVPEGTQVIRDGSVHLDPIVANPVTAQERLRYDEIGRIAARGLRALTTAETTEYVDIHSRLHSGGRMPRHVGEIPSMPLLVDRKKHLKDPLFWENWLKTFFPQHFNHTCGLHVHMSMRTVGTYQRLMDPDFQPTVVEYIRRWAEREKLDKENPIWKRLAGECEYCQHKYYANEQARQAQKDYDRQRHGHRYTFIHYPFVRNGTVECRGLSMFPLDQAIRAVNELLSITNAFIVTTAKQDSEFKSILQIEDQQFHEEMSTCV